MAKLHIFYNYSSHNSITHNNLKVIINDTLEIEVEKDKEIIVELAKGIHNIKMYIPFKTKTYGYTVKSIEMLDKDLFYLYKLPLIYTNPGKFIQVNNSKDFYQLKKKTKVVSTIITILIILILILITFF